jgi:phosphoketolase
LANLATNPEHVAQLEKWMRSYRPEELFDEDGALRERARARNRHAGANADPAEFDGVIVGASIHLSRHQPTTPTRPAHPRRSSSTT